MTFEAEHLTYPLPGEIVRLNTGRKVQLFPLHLVDEQGRLVNRYQVIDETRELCMRETVRVFQCWRDTRSQHRLTQG